ncbi:MAG: hypothetical protein KBS60_00445 [Phascolarctobacterium sp.]|nr:hypothetical protein [Candidatus Phascolarctobacterium caballi]
MKYDTSEMLFSEVQSSFAEGNDLLDVAREFNDNGRTFFEMRSLLQYFMSMWDSLLRFFAACQLESRMETEQDRVEVGTFINELRDEMMDEIKNSYKRYSSVEFDDYRIRDWQQKSRDVLQRVKESFS